MEIFESDKRSTTKARSDWFTGDVWMDEIAAAGEPSRLRVLRVTFAPGARTAWHTHPTGQILHVVSGIGFVQLEGQPARTIKPGDTVVIEPGERHWHGATPGHLFVHLAIQGTDEAGNSATWFEHVSEEEYHAGN